MAEFLDAAFLAIYEHLRARGDITPEEKASLHDFRAKGIALSGLYSQPERKR